MRILTARGVLSIGTRGTKSTSGTTSWTPRVSRPSAATTAPCRKLSRIVVKVRRDSAASMYKLQVMSVILRFIAQYHLHCRGQHQLQSDGVSDKDIT